MAVQIRGRNADDWFALAEICRALPLETNPFGMPFLSDDLAREAFKAPDHNFTYGLVAIFEGRLVGEVSIGRNQGRQVHCAHIHRLIVDPGYQGRGIGAALLDGMIDMAENSLGITRLDHLIAADNAPALTLHRKHGFVIEGKLRDLLFVAGRYVDAYMLARVRDAF